LITVEWVDGKEEEEEEEEEEGKKRIRYQRNTSP
jgi:hypothetical protein